MEDIFAVQVQTFFDKLPELDFDVSIHDYNSKIFYCLEAKNAKATVPSGSTEKQSLNRAQFLELIFRFNDMRMFKKEGGRNQKESVNALIAHLKKFWTPLDSSKWREKTYFHPSTEEIFIHFQKLISNIFSQYSQESRNNYYYITLMHVIVLFIF
jgi:hypothetical protein